MNIKDNIILEKINGHINCRYIPFDNYKVSEHIEINYFKRTKREVLKCFSNYVLSQLPYIASNGYINVLDIYHGVNEYILIDKTSNYLKLYYTKDNVYFNYKGVKYNLNEFFRC